MCDICLWYMFVINSHYLCKCIVIILATCIMSMHLKINNTMQDDNTTVGPIPKSIPLTKIHDS